MVAQATPRKSLTRTLIAMRMPLTARRSDDAIAMEFDVADAAVGAIIARLEADRKREGVEPQARLDPAGSIPHVAV